MFLTDTYTTAVETAERQRQPPPDAKVLQAVPRRNCSCRLTHFHERTAMKEYQVTINQPGRRWKIIHNLPKPENGMIQKTYFVSLGTGARLSCSCKAGQYNKPCKHVKFIANLIGKPELVSCGSDATPF